jgi:positive regulator of sigma E activity
VVIGVEDTVLLRSAFAVYAAPLAGLIAGGVLGHSVASGAEGITILMSLAGLALGVLGGDRQNRSWQRVLRCQPVVLRRVGGGPHEALANEQGG